MASPKLPGWLEEMGANQNAEVVHQYILHGNVHDLIPSEGAFEGALPFTSFRDYLNRVLKVAKYDLVLFYSRSGGLKTRDNKTSELLKEAFASPVVETAATANKAPGGDAGVNFTLEEAVAEFRPQVREPMPVRQAFLFIEELLRQAKYRVAIIIEHVDKLAPDVAHDQISPDDSTSIESLRRWALDPEVQIRTDNLLIGVTENLGRVSREIYGSQSQCRPIRVPLPSAEERKQFLDHTLAEFAAKGRIIELGLGPEAGTALLANLTKGFTLVNLDHLFRRAAMAGAKVTPELVKEMKREIVQTESAGLLEEKEPRSGFESIGGLEHIKSYLLKVKASLDRKETALIPKGILLAGPPGTGKTIIAEAFAKETGRNLVKMGDLRSKWVGDSERNLSRALQIIRDIAPVIVFIDEIDQAIGSRGVGGSGDSGTGERMFARILETMGSNELRGEVIWVAASNRADVLDEAMVRRFDRVFPILIPGTSAERLAITLAMRFQIEDMTFAKETEAELRRQSGAAPGAEGGTPSAEAATVKAFGDDTIGLTGSDLEIIVRRAKELAGGQAVDGNSLVAAAGLYKKNHHQDMYDLQTLLAVSVCNFVDMIPAVEAFPQDLQPVIAKVLKDRSNVVLEDAIRELKVRVNMKRMV